MADVLIEKMDAMTAEAEAEFAGALARLCEGVREALALSDPDEALCVDHIRRVLDQSLESWASEGCLMLDEGFSPTDSALDLLERDVRPAARRLKRIRERAALVRRLSKD